MNSFYKDYYPYPLYRDANLKFYEALGNQAAIQNIGWNPIRWVQFLRKMMKRTKKKGITGNNKGDGNTRGGIIIFGADGSPKYVYPEKTGYELDVDDLMAAINAVRGDMTTTTTNKRHS